MTASYWRQTLPQLFRIVNKKTQGNNHAAMLCSRELNRVPRKSCWRQFCFGCHILPQLRFVAFSIGRMLINVVGGVDFLRATLSKNNVVKLVFCRHGPHDVMASWGFFPEMRLGGGQLGHVVSALFPHGFRMVIFARGLPYAFPL